MARKRRRNDPLAVLAEILPGIVVLVIIILWVKTGSLSTTATVLVVVAALFLGVGYFLYRRKRKKLLESGIDIIDNMSGKMFEEMLLEHFRKLGFKGTTTATTADYGADLILTKNNVKYVVQAKRWKQNVGIEAVQQIVAAIKHYNADKGIVITNSYFTKNAENLALSNQVELWDRDKLINILSQARGKELAEEVAQAKNLENSVEEICPRCGNKLVVRNGKRGRFYGCSSFPKCRFTKSYTESGQMALQSMYEKNEGGWT